MTLRETILGFLSWKPFTGYELKKLFADSLSFYWSGNSNQIYGSLIQLHKDGDVSIELQEQDKYPTRKVYAITEKGREELRAWLKSEPALPETRELFQIQLAWAEPLSADELDSLFASYELLLASQITMCRETARRGGLRPERSERESLIWKRIEEGRIAAYESELAWARSLRGELAHLSGGGEKP